MLNFGYNMTIIKSVIYANFQDLRSRDCDLGRGGQYRGTVPRYFFSTVIGTVVTF